MIVDTHVHVIADDERRYPLRPSSITGPWYREAPISVEGFLSLMDETGVERAVLVQPMSAYGCDNSYVLDAAAIDPRLTGVCIVDVSDRPGETLRGLAEERGASGVRVFAIEPGPRPADWFDDEHTFPLMESAAELGLRVVVAALPAQLEQVGRALDRFPDVPVFLDHCGFPDLSGGPPYAGARSLFDLHRYDNLYLKVTSHVLEPSDGRDLVDRLAEVFGGDRLVWGSDFPQTHDRPYPALVDLARWASSRLCSEDQRRFLGLNALRLWQWPS